MKIFFSSVAVLALTAATAATAGSVPDVITEPAVFVEPPLPMTSWEGFYAGGLYSRYSADETFHTNIDDANIGAFAGYNFQKDAFVFGGEIAYAKGSITDANLGGSGDVTVLDLKARLGYVPSDALMVYAFGGYTAAQIKGSNGPADFDGYNYGVGAAFQFNNGALLGVEYVARNLDGSGGLATGESLNSGAIEVRIGWQF
jgi:opacity protein-like surface antigen